MTFPVMSYYAILNPFAVLYLPLKFIAIFNAMYKQTVESHFVVNWEHLLNVLEVICTN